jgi:hypothetical protein
MSKYIEDKEISQVSKLEAILYLPMGPALSGLGTIMAASVGHSLLLSLVGGFTMGAVPLLVVLQNEIIRNPFKLKQRITRTAVAKEALKKDLKEVYGITVKQSHDLIALLQHNEVRIYPSDDRDTTTIISLDPQTSVPIVATSVTAPTVTTIEHAKPVTHAITSGNTSESSAEKREPAKVLPASLFSS